jgi:uncharacterized Zn finger protein
MPVRNARAPLFPRAAQMLTAGWTHIESVTPDSVTARVVDKERIFTVTWTAGEVDGEWHCDCPYWGGSSPCAHAAAVMAVTQAF